MERLLQFQRRRLTFPRVWGNWQQWCDNDRLKLLKSTEGEKEMKIYHGAILTVNEKNEVFEYLVEYRGKIVYTGNELPKKYKHAEVIELGNRALIPPFADTHQHLASFSAFPCWPQCDGGSVKPRNPGHGEGFCLGGRRKNADRVRRVTVFCGGRQTCEQRRAG